MMKWLIVILFLCTITNGKRVRKTITLNKESNWHYISKFGISIGHGKFSLWGRFKQPLTSESKWTMYSGWHFQIKVGMYMDTKWMEALSEDSCQGKLNAAIRTENLVLPIDGSWSGEVPGSLGQRTRPYVWFISISDCDNLFEQRETLPDVEIEIHFTGSNGEEFTHEEIGLLLVYGVALILYVSILFFVLYNYYKEIKKTQKLESPIMFLCMAMMLESLAIFLRGIHLLSYASDGQGIYFFQVLSIILEISSQFILSLLLLMLSWGWSILYEMKIKRKTVLTLMVPLFIFHVVTAGLTELSFDAYHKYHDFEGIQGILLVVVRLGILYYFFSGMEETLGCCKARARNFLGKLKYIGASYLLSFPILNVLCLICAHYVRLKVMIIGTLISQTAVMCILLRFFIGHTSYTEVSRQSDTILPGGKNY